MSYATLIMAPIMTAAFVFVLALMFMGAILALLEKRYRFFDQHSLAIALIVAFLPAAGVGAYSATNVYFRLKQPDVDTMAEAVAYAQKSPLHARVMAYVLEQHGIDSRAEATHYRMNGIMKAARARYEHKLASHFEQVVAGRPIKRLSTNTNGNMDLAMNRIDFANLVQTNHQP